jgi:hypothetical protein
LSTDPSAPPTAGNQWLSVGNNGYFSGGNVGKAMHDSSVNAVSPAVAYISWSDASKLNGTAGEGPISWIGQSSWVGGTFPTTGAWNVSGVENGSYTLWTYERFYINPGDVGGFVATTFSPGLITAVQYEIQHHGAFETGLGDLQTAILESEMNVYRNSDGADVLHN